MENMCQVFPVIFFITRQALWQMKIINKRKCKAFLMCWESVREDLQHKSLYTRKPTFSITPGS